MVVVEKVVVVGKMVVMAVAVAENLPKIDFGKHYCPVHSSYYQRVTAHCMA
jgi:hypothetical protein